MNSELTNLIPAAQRKAFRTEYFIRLATIGTLLLVVLVVIQGVFLLPSYLYQRVVVNTRTQQLQQLSANLTTTEEQDAQSQLTSLTADTQYLLGLKTSGTASAVLREVLNVPQPGITLTGFTFQQASGGSSRSMQLSGIASTRETLRSFDAALSALPFVSNADLPISSYAKDTNIPFSITLTGTLQP